MSLNLGRTLRQSALNFPNSTACILGDSKLSYRELDQEACRVANWLKKSGVQPRDHVALMMPNVPGFTASYFGILYTGATVVPLNVLLKGQEIQYFLENSDAVHFIFHEMFAEEAKKALQKIGRSIEASIYSTAGLQPWKEQPAEFDIFPTSSEDTAVILYTSGTTGKSKGAELTHFNIYDNTRFSCERLTMKDLGKITPITQGDTALVCLPLFHSFGQVVIQNAFIMGGATLSYLPKFTPSDAVKIIERDRCTFFAGVPTMYFAILNMPADEVGNRLGTLKYCISGGASLPVEVLESWEKRFTTEILEGYGLSETSPVATFNSLWKGRKVGSVGPAILGCETAIANDQGQFLKSGEIGEIWIRGYNIMKGYYKNPVATREVITPEGWFKSGDIGKMDSDGFVFILDRKKDMVIRGGYNVYPREIEEFLYTHPAVREAAVIGIPDAKLGEEVKAVVSLKEGKKATPQEIMEFCKENLASYKYPREVEIIADLPKGPTGKILKRELRK